MLRRPPSSLPSLPPALEPYSKSIPHMRESGLGGARGHNHAVVGRLQPHPEPPVSQRHRRGLRWARQSKPQGGWATREGAVSKYPPPVSGTLPDTGLSSLTLLGTI